MAGVLEFVGDRSRDVALALVDSLEQIYMSLQSQRLGLFRARYIFSATGWQDGVNCGFGFWSEGLCGLLCQECRG